MSNLVAKAHLKVAERLDDAEQAGHAQVGLYHARRCLADTEARGLVDFDLAYAHEVMARALAATGDVDGARSHWETAQGVPIALDEDRALVHADLAVAPF